MSTSNFHVALIMDGNGRWAQRQGKTRLWGHQQGAKVLKAIVQACPCQGVRYLTVYAFSSENWKRETIEVEGLMGLFVSYLKRETAELHRKGVCLKIIGNRSVLSSELISLIGYAEELTKANTQLGLQIAINYGGREEILSAVRKLATLVKNDRLLPEDITVDHMTRSLWTYPWPDPDLLIRTGGEYRLSNYLLWQMSYTEFLFFRQAWPEFTVEDFRQAIALYHQRDRRFGGLSFHPAMQVLLP